jgi:hypothetical protein
MKRFLSRITDLLADAALMEMGVEGETTTEHRSQVEFAPGMSLLKRFFQNVTDTLADAALLEMGVDVVTPATKTGTVRETLEENLIEAAFAEEADYDDIHEAILREHRSERDIAQPDDCQYGDNDLCFV